MARATYCVRGFNTSPDGSSIEKWVAAPNAAEAVRMAETLGREILGALALCISPDAASGTMTVRVLASVGAIPANVDLAEFRLK